MGYRNYLGKMSKKVYEEVKDKNQEEMCKLLKEEDSYFSPRDIESFQEFYELGKYCEFDIKEYTSNFFNNIPEDGDTEFLLATKEFFLMIIEDYRKYVVSYYEKLLAGKVEITFNKKKTIEDHVEDRIKKWSGNWIPYELSEGTDSIVSSWEYEYAVFDLVRLFKTFDWENDVLIYTGH